MFTISLEKIKITAAVGLYAQEQMLGNDFEIDVAVKTEHYSDQEFVDYGVLHEIVKRAFATPSLLLEPLAQAIHQKIKTIFPFIKSAKVSIRKMNPPLGGQIAAAQVVFEQ